MTRDIRKIDEPNKKLTEVVCETAHNLCLMFSALGRSMNSEVLNSPLPVL
jgi:hypothetical protein